MQRGSPLFESAFERLARGEECYEDCMKLSAYERLVLSYELTKLHYYGDRDVEPPRLRKDIVRVIRRSEYKDK